MKVIWSGFAIKMLKEINLYYKERASIKLANSIRKDVFSATKQLHKYPLSGSEEQALKHLKQNHRYLVNGNYKIIYKPIKEGVLITDIFDTRQNPDKSNNQKR
jgi:plasmid stabilization system protein ParE